MQILPSRSSSDARPVPGPPAAVRTFWLRQFRVWHWTSSAVCLIALVFFAATGLTLNHAALIDASPETREWTGALPESLLADLRAGADHGDTALPAAVADWLEARVRLTVAGRAVEWSAGEAYVGLPRPGGDAWIAIDLRSGDVLFEQTTRGAVSFLNDLHKGRHTGPAWSLFIDLVAVACIVFAVTGLGLLLFNARARPSTWPLVGLGLLLPGLLVILSIH